MPVPIPHGDSDLKTTAEQRAKIRSKASRDASVGHKAYTEVSIEVVLDALDDINTLLARAAHAEAALRERVTVKPLEWHDDPFTGSLDAKTPFGSYYEISHCRDGYVLYHCYDRIGVFSTLDDAKAAAQADYEARILSAITTEPVTVTDEMVERAGAAIAGALGLDLDEVWGAGKPALEAALAPTKGGRS